MVLAYLPQCLPSYSLMVTVPVSMRCAPHMPPSPLFPHVSQHVGTGLHAGSPLCCLATVVSGVHWQDFPALEFLCPHHFPSSCWSYTFLSVSYYYFRSELALGSALSSRIAHPVFSEFMSIYSCLYPNGYMLWRLYISPFGQRE